MQDVNFNYSIRLSNEAETLIVDMEGTFAEAYEVARNYQFYADKIAFVNSEGEEIVTLTKKQLMDRNLTIQYKD